MNEAIAAAIALNCRFDEIEIKNSFDRCHSWDTVISAINISDAFNVSLIYATDLLSNSFDDDLIA